MRDIKWFSVWCDEFSVDFGNVVIPKNLDFPRPQKIAGLNGIHAVHSDNIVIVDAQTLLIPNFSYDGTAPGNDDCNFYFTLTFFIARYLLNVLVAGKLVHNNGIYYGHV